MVMIMAYLAENPDQADMFAALGRRSLFRQPVTVNVRQPAR
jgi:hypothetical protein